MRYMLDTNVVSDLYKKIEKVERRLYQHRPDDLVISTVAQGELLFGLAKNPGAKHRREVLDFLQKNIRILPWDERAARTYGDLKAEMERGGLQLKELDMMIAAHCLAEKLDLVTSDMAFRHVPDLTIENWRE